MRLFLVVAASASVLSGATAADEARVPGCLSQAETREAVMQKTVVEPITAIRAARGAAGGGRVIRANLCREEATLTYHITTLHRDGKVKRVTVDGPSGKVGSIR
jgi:uncharacterized membrane protein YkoI